jgi:hypothetical protein
MAITQELTKNVPYIKSNKVQEWDLEYTYENDSEGDATYYTSTFTIHVDAIAPDGTVNFTPKAKNSWTYAQLVALCPVSQWDSVFAKQVESVITNPPSLPVPDDNFPVPS